MTREEKIALLRGAQTPALSREQKIAMLRESPTSQEPTRPGKGEGEGMDLQDVRGFGQALLSGQLAGFADEAIGAARTGIDAILPDTEADRIAAEFGGEDQSLSDSYAMYRDDARESAREFAEENAGTALAAEITGAIASPLNKIMPGVGTKGTAGERLLGSATRGMAEGGLYGLGQGEGDASDQIQNAALGAVLGGGSSALLTGAGGKIGRALSKKRVDEDLVDAAGNFKPVHMADKEGALGQLYRNVVGGSWGGRGALGKQESKYLNKASRLARFADEGKDLVEDTVGTAAEVRRLKRSVEDARRIATNKAKFAAQKIDADDVGTANRYALKRSAPEGYADAITDIGDKGVKQAGTAINRAYNDAWGDAISSPAILGGVKSVAKDASKELKKRERESLSRVISSLEEGGSLQLADRELRDLLGGKISDELSKAVRGIRGTLRGGLPVERQGLLEATDRVYPNYLASLRASTSPGASARDGAFSSKELNSAAKAIGGWRNAGKGGSELFEQTKPMLKKTAALKAAAKQKDKRAGEVSRASIDRISKEAEGILPETVTAWSQAAPTALLGGLGAFLGPAGAASGLAAGVGIARGLASPKAQTVLAGQSGLQKALAKALRQGDTAKYQRILSRIAAQQATGE